MLSRCAVKWWELRDSLVDFSQRWQGIRQRRRTRALLCTFMLWFNRKGVFFRVENFFNFALLMNKIRSPASYSRKLSCLFCKKLYTAKIKWTRSFDSIESFQFDLIKSVIVTFLIISAVFTNFQLMLFKICSQTLINLKHIQKLDVRFHTKVRSPICQCSLAVQNTHRRAL